MTQKTGNKPASPDASSGRPPLGVYLSTVVVLFFCTFSAADSVGLVPCFFDGTCNTSDSSIAISQLPMLGDESGAITATPTVAAALPTNIVIESENIDLPVQNPQTTDETALDTILLKGPARFPTSAGLGVDGTVVIFAHSSHLPIVKNKMFQAFNSIPDMKAGDSITVRGDDGKDYLYSVQSVEKASVETKILTSPSLGKRLVLVTCDNFSGKSARYMLTATFVGTI